MILRLSFKITKIVTGLSRGTRHLAILKTYQKTMETDKFLIQVMPDDGYDVAIDADGQIFRSQCR